MNTTTNTLNTYLRQVGKFLSEIPLSATMTVLISIARQILRDLDYVDEVTGEVFTGLRQYGFSKDHKPNPLVEIGLFMDTNGIPISMCIAPGNTNEQTTVIPLEKELYRCWAKVRRNSYIVLMQV